VTFETNREHIEMQLNATYPGCNHLTLEYLMADYTAPSHQGLSPRTPIPSFVISLVFVYIHAIAMLMYPRRRTWQGMYSLAICQSGASPTSSKAGTR